MNGYKLPKPSDIEQEMIASLERISKDEKFLFGIRATLETDELRQEMSDAIADGDVQTEEDAIYYALQLDHEGVVHG
ncbi:hypothetical protein [Acidaminococcus timonensis]|uniref:hypothetical protein n=1 Tax=Acidaminococcus timonensis TaxID=1871002 RepID=UPI002665E6F1|nr:hypothetical protein [uncultured Acidaminococcus sp.]